MEKKIYIYFHRIGQEKTIGNPGKISELFLVKTVRTLRNYMNKITRLNKAIHYRNFFEKNNKNMLKTWNGINQIINIDKKSTQKIKLIFYQGA